MSGVELTHPQYDAATPIWQRITDAEAGEDAIKARCIDSVANGARTGTDAAANARFLRSTLGCYLPKPEGQDLASYATYLSDAVYFNAVARTIDGLVGAVWRRDPDIALSAPLKPLEDNADRQGTPLSIMAKRAFRDVLTYGRHGLLLDLPVDAQVGAVPYLTGYRPWDMVNWQLTVSDSGPELTCVVLREHYTTQDPDDEFAEEGRCRYRVLDLDEGGRYRVRLFTPTEKDEYEETVVTPAPQRGGGIDYIPFVFLSPNGLEAAVAKSPILDLVNLNLHDFRLSAKENHALFIVSVPQPVVKGSTVDGQGQPLEFRIGGDLAWALSADGDAFYLEHAGTGIASIANARQSIQAQMVLLGARLLEPQKREAETAEAMRLRQAGESATLANVADTTSWGMSRLLGWAAEWVGASPDENYITLNQEFSDTTMTEDEAVKIAQRWQMGAATEEDMFLLYKRGGRIDPEITFEQWKMLLEEQAPKPVALPVVDEDAADLPDETEQPAAA